MDKETLSNYGWIVICVLVMAVMIALAGPFGTFVSDAVKSTTQGLFDVNQGALGAAGIEIEDNGFGVKMLDGNNQSYLQGHAETLSFRSSAEMKDFESVEVDGATVAENNYTVTEGSTIITFLEDYLNQLPVGTHTVTIVSATGKATATFIVEDVAEINGKWVFNKTLNQGTNPNATVSVNYATDGTSYRYMDIYDGGIIYYNVVAEAFTVYNGSWVDDELRTIDFGKNTQFVSKSFYEWLTANATQAPVVYELSGKWVFNETLNKGTNPNATVSVNYTIDGNSYRYMDVYDGMIIYSNSGTDAFMSYNEGWMDDAYKIVDFGTSSQTVSKAFYEWFTANASKQ